MYSGSLIILSAAKSLTSQYAPKGGLKEYATRSPILKFSTSSATSMILPAASKPGQKGKSSGNGYIPVLW